MLNEKELADDLIAISTDVAAKAYGNRVGINVGVASNGDQTKRHGQH